MAKKISANKIVELTKLTQKNPVTLKYALEDEVLEIEVKSFIPYDERAILVEDAANMCFDDKGEYHAYAKEFAKAICILRAYTNVKTDVELYKLYALIKNTSIMDDISGRIDGMFILDKEIEEAIEWKKQTILHDKNNELIESLVIKEKAIANLLGALGTVLDGISKQQDENGNVFTAEKITEYFNTLAKFDEKKLAYSVLDYEQSKQEREQE